MISLIKYGYVEEKMSALGKVAMGLGAAALYTIDAIKNKGEDPAGDLRKLIKPNVDNLPTKPNIPKVNTDIPLDREDAREEVEDRRMKQQAQQLKDQGRVSGKFVGGKLMPKGYDDSHLTFQQKIDRAVKNQRPNVG